VNVQISSGTLAGTRDERGICAWLGIPYAAPPVGELRFAAPQPPPAWTGERDATQYGKAAMQLSSATPVAEPMVQRLGTSEDCLTLNVWSPAADGAKRPVLVWIHGGAFMMGTAATYSGAELAALGDLVVVTVNYRLGPLGFVAFPGAATNCGLRDQLAALAWVQENIAAFGGDPDRVTVAGESAGSVAVSLHLISPNARGLFRAAIAQSGSISLVATAERGRELASLYTAALGDDLRAVPAQRFVDVHMQIMMANLGTVTTRPVLDGDVLPATPEALFAAPHAPVPLLSGSNKDEATLFALLRLLPTEHATLAQLLETRVAPDLARRVLAEYAADRAGGLELARDALFAMPMIHFAEQHPAPAFHYRFDWPTPAFGGSLGAMHALEVFLMWLDIERPRAQALLGGPPSAEVRALALRMKRHWIAFVRDLDPGWPPYSPTRSVKIFDLIDHVERDPEASRRAAWAGLDGVEQ
jgi:para-nitrobenzyl esterase